MLATAMAALVALPSAPAMAAKEVVVKGFGNRLAFGRYAWLDTAVSMTDTFCIAGTAPAMLVSFDGHRAGGGFALEDGGGGTMRYRVHFAPAQGGFREVRPGEPVSMAPGAESCSADNVSVRVEIMPDDFNGAASGLYADTLTVIVSTP